MKKLLSILTITTLTASVPAPLLANTVQTRVKRDVGTTNKEITNGLQIQMSDIKNLNLNWKIISGTFNEEFNVRNNKLYIMSVRKSKTTDDFIIIKFKNNDIDKPFGNVWNNGVALDGEWYSVTELFRWEGVLEPITLPLIDVKTGKVVNWNDITPFQKGINFSIADDKNGYWIKPYQLVTNGQVKVKIVNTDIDTVKVNGSIMPSPNKSWDFDLPVDSTTVENKDYKIEIAFKIDGKSYIGQIIVSSLLTQPSITVQKNTSSFGNVASYIYQVPTNDKVGNTTLTSDLYYSDTEVKVSLNQPTGTTVQNGIVYGLNEKWQKNGQKLDITGNVSLNATMLNSYQGRFLVETKDSAVNSSFYYVVLNKDNLTPNFWNTDQGEQFYQWANFNDYNESIKKLNATESNKIIKASANWKKIAPDSQFATALAVWFKTNGKLSVTESLTKEQVIEQLKTQIPSTIKIPDVNTSNYDVNKVSFVLKQGEFNPNDKVNITVKYNNATSEQFTLQIKNTNTPDNNKKSGLGIWAIFGIVVGSLLGLFVLWWLFKKFVVDPFILKPIREKKEKAFVAKTEKDIAQMKKDDEEWEAKQRGDK
ncbi:MAG: hypothetical protein EHV01_001490 [Spiroplasma sp. hy2]|uniref:hypothetical protein n=1 Tax=Spiroplasma sp. hy2 TaxID=2490850 RepID=UPI00383CFBD8